MPQSKAINLVDLTSVEVKAWLGTFDTVVTDCDGVLWHHEQFIEGSPDVINTLQTLGKNVYYVTNNATKTRHDIWKHATKLGFNLKEQQITTPNITIIDFFKGLNFKEQVYVIGNQAITDELSAAGIESFGAGPDPFEKKLIDYIENDIAKQEISNIGAVIVSWDEHFSYVKMMKAVNILTTKETAYFIATNLDAVNRFPHYCIPGAGAFVSAIETAVERAPLNMGKPNPTVLQPLIAAGKIKPKRTLMIGDCCKADVQFGKNCGLQTLLVGSGNYSLDEVRALQRSGENNALIPDYFVPKLGDLLNYL